MVSLIMILICQKYSHLIGQKLRLGINVKQVELDFEFDELINYSPNDRPCKFVKLVTRWRSLNPDKALANHRRRFKYQFENYKIFRQKWNKKYSKSTGILSQEDIIFSRQVIDFENCSVGDDLTLIM